MAQTQAIYGLIARVTDPSVDRAMAAALATADVADQARLATLLIQRNHPDGVAALVEHYDCLETDTRQWVLDHVADLYRPLRETARRDSTPVVANTLTIIRDSGEMKLAYLASERLRHGDAELRRLAADCLLDLTLRTTQRDAAGEPIVSGHEARYLHIAIEEAVKLYRHHEQPQIAQALLMLSPRPLPQAMAELENWRNPIVDVLKAMLSEASEPVVRTALLPMLGVGNLTPAVLSGLRSAAEADALGDVLVLGHLLLLPRVRQHLKTIAHPEVLWPTEGSLSYIAPVAARHLPTWVAVLPLDVDVQMQRLVLMRHAADAMTRLGALRRILDIARRDPARDFGNAIAAFCEDAEESIGRVALCELIRQKWSGLGRLLPRLVNGPHERVRKLASQHLAPLGFDRLWERWPQLSRAQRLGAGRALLKLDPRFHESLGRRLISSDRETIVRALSIIADLNQGAFFEAALIELARHTDRRVASTAVRALGSAESVQVQQALEAALNDKDARVRANAVEALQQISSTRHVQRLVDMAENDDNRPRANAIKALLEMNAGEAVGSLTQMLGDSRAKHRRSALWLVETLGLVEVARHVAELAVADPDPAIKQRAGRVMHELIESLRSAKSHTTDTTTACWAWPVMAMAILASATAPPVDERWVSIREHFRSGNLMSVWWIAVASGLLLVLLAVLSIRRIRDQAEAKSAPMLVFRRIADEIGLSLADQWLLVRIARQQTLPSPVTLLLSEGTMMHHAVAFAATLSDRKRRATLLRVDQLRQSLFATSGAAQSRRRVA